MSRNKNELHPLLLEAYEYAKKRFMGASFHFKPFITCTHRSIEEQKELYSQGRDDKKDKVTNCDGVKKKSKHNYLPSLAFDIAFLRIGTRELSWDTFLFDRFNKYVQEFAHVNNVKIRWGGTFKSFVDAPHFEIAKYYANV